MQRGVLITGPVQLSHRLVLGSLIFLFQLAVIVPHAHWEAYGRGSLPLVSDSAYPHHVSDPLPQSFVAPS